MIQTGAGRAGVVFMRSHGNVLIVGFALLSAVAVLRAQAPVQPRTPRFSVVSIRRQPPGVRWRTPEWGSPGPVRAGGLYVDHQALVPYLIRFAYPGYFRPGQTILGLPDWATRGNVAVFDFEARCSPGTSLDEMRLMMRTALANRFGLKFHYENRMLPVGILTLRKGGVKTVTPAPPQELASYLSSLIGWSQVYVSAKSFTIPELAQWLIGGPIVDRTGLHGRFDLDIPIRNDMPPPGAAQGDRHALITQFFRDKLNINLTAGKARIPVMVVDSIHLPTPN